MKSVKNYKLEEETPEEQFKGRRYNPATMLVYQDKHGKHRVMLDSGQTDDIHIFREGDVTYVLSLNTKYGYAGLQCFQKGQQTGSIFFQSGEQLEEIVGKNWDNYSPITITKRLAQYCM